MLEAFLLGAIIAPWHGGILDIHRLDQVAIIMATIYPGDISGIWIATPQEGVLPKPPFEEGPLLVPP